MASKRRLRRKEEQKCSTKIHYATEAKAIEQAHNLRRRSLKQAGLMVFDAYRCCDRGWCVGRRSRKQSQRLKKRREEQA